MRLNAWNRPLVPSVVAPIVLDGAFPVHGCPSRVRLMRHESCRVSYYGSEPSLNQKVSLPSFMRSHGALRADPCCAVCYAILTSPPLCSKLFLFTILTSFLTGRGSMWGRKSCRYRKQCAEETPPTSFHSPWAPGSAGVVIRLSYSAAANFFPDQPHVGHCARRQLFRGQQHVVMGCVTAVVPDRAPARNRLRHPIGCIGRYSLFE